MAYLFIRSHWQTTNKLQRVLNAAARVVSGTTSSTLACSDSYIPNYIGSMYRSGSRSSSASWCSTVCDMELVTRQSERLGHQQRLLQTFTEDVFIFGLLVYT